MDAIYVRKQGDSLWLDITSTNTVTADPVWANWAGKWSISATVGSTPLLSGTLAPSVTPGLFYLRIGPALTVGWSALPVGIYVLTTEINNSGVDYKYEEQAKLIIQAQGIV